MPSFQNCGLLFCLRKPKCVSLNKHMHRNLSLANRLNVSSSEKNTFLKRMAD